MSKEPWRISKTLTDKHKELMPYLADGKSNRYIAKKLGVVPQTIYNHVECMMDILRYTDRAELVEYAKAYMKKQEKIP